MDMHESAQDRLDNIVKVLANQKRPFLQSLQNEGLRGLTRPDFLWHYLIESFATLGAAAGYEALISNCKNYNRLTYGALASLEPEPREAQVYDVCLSAQQQGLRYPNRKAKFILGCFKLVTEIGGPEIATRKLMGTLGREAKIWFLDAFPGIGPKYARNIMMTVYHADFRDSIAVDSRIKSVSKALRLSFSSYSDHEAFYRQVAHNAGVNGWELDRLIFWFKDDILAHLNGGAKRPINRLVLQKKSCRSA
jgi:hypothetical protein